MTEVFPFDHKTERNEWWVLLSSTVVNTSARIAGDTWFDSMWRGIILLFRSVVIPSRCCLADNWVIIIWEKNKENRNEDITISHLLDCLRLSLSLFTWFGILFSISWAISLSISWYSIDSYWYVSWRKPNATSGSWRKCILDSIKCASLSSTESCQNNFQSLWVLKLFLCITSKWRRMKT